MTYFRTIRKSEAQLISDSWEKAYSEGKKPLDGFKPIETDRELREGIVGIFEELDKGEYGYLFDSNFGLKLYVFFRELGVTESDAANNEFWYHLQMKVVPDIMMKRWPMTNGEVNKKRFWSQPSRLYLKVIWWYIDLIWAGDEESTRRYLAPVDISQILDRSGRGGTRRDVYRAIMHVYAEIPPKERTKRLIDKVLMLDSTYCTVVEPELMSISLDEYARRLYREVGVYV